MTCWTWCMSIKRMKTTLLAFVLFWLGLGACTAQTFTEFFVNAATGSNANAGSPISGGIYPKSYAGGTWVQATGVFTVAAGNPATDGEVVGDFASINPGTDAVYVCRITALSSTTFTCSTTAKAGTSPANGTYTAIIGGTWKGPNGSDAFPLGFIAGTTTDAAGDVPRINFKNNASYLPTANIVQNQNGPIVFQGYSSVPGDGITSTANRAILDFGTLANSNGLTVSGNNVDFWDFDVRDADTTGSQPQGLIFANAAHPVFGRVSCH